MRRSRILGTGSYLPERIILNETVGRGCGLSPEAVSRVTGIERRRWAASDQASSDLAGHAANAALEAAGVPAGAVDAVIVSTTSPDTPLPSTACYLQRRLGLGPVAAFDVSASCSGFLYALSMGDALVRSGQAKTCLIVAAEVKSRFLDPTDDATAILFGDGAGAVLLGCEQDPRPTAPGILAVRLASDGSRHHLIRMAAGGSRKPTSAETLGAREHHLAMQGGPLFRLAVRRAERAIRDMLKEFGVTFTDIAQVVCHQANGRILEQLRRRLAIPVAKMTSVIEGFGNTSSASVPIALDVAVRAGSVGKGDLCLLAAFGGGLTWGAALVRW
jgi:3-oxoacyl-[acyl-carrier-protein] synthase-3